MIKHVVCFQLKDAALIEQWIHGSEMLADIDTVRNFSAAPLLKQDNFHCALYMEFEDEAGLSYYQKHDIHQRYLKDVLPPILESKLVVDLVVETAV